MTYIEPSAVHAPKRYWSLIHVIFDGGEGGSSLAIGRWANTPVLAMRWNGTKDNPLGNPQSRGLPTWFVVPDQHWKQILETEQYKAINEDTLNLARHFLELERVYFVSRCPKPECRDYQKLVLHEWRTNQLGAALKELEQDELKLYHIICNGFWKPSPQEKTDLAAVLKTAWENHRLRSEVRLSARLREDGRVEYSKKGDGGFVSDLRPDQLRGQLLANGAFEDHIDPFEKQLAESGSAEMWIPRPTSRFFAVQGPV